MSGSSVGGSISLPRLPGGCHGEGIWPCPGRDGPMGGELQVQLAEDGADAERVDALTGYLRQELLQLDVEDVTALRAGEPPPGARVFDVIAVGGLLVSLGRSAESLRGVVSAIRKWLTRGDGVRRT